MQYALHMGLAVPRHTGMAPGPGHGAGVGYGTWDPSAVRETKDPSRLRGATRLAYFPRPPAGMHTSAAFHFAHARQTAEMAYSFRHISLYSSHVT